MLDRKIIIMVDDSMANLTMGRNMLKTFYDVCPVSSAEQFFVILETLVPDLVLLDIEMPGMDGYEVLQKMKKDPRFADIPVIFITTKTDAASELEGFELGAVEYISKPFSVSVLLKRISNQLLIVQQKKDLLASQAAIRDYAENLEEKVREKTRAVVKLQNAVLTIVADLVEFRDEFSGSHIVRTRHYLQALTEEIIREGIYINEIAKWDMEYFLSSAQLHDVGKIAIPDHILNKPSRLSPEEFEIMKTHVTAGVDAIEKIMKTTDEHVFLHHALIITGTHHEKWDGTGYPMGLKGRNIPLEGRLMAIADVYDALVTVRPYKKALPHREACEIIKNCSGTHFDPALADAFARVEPLFEQIAVEIAA